MQQRIFLLLISVLYCSILPAQYQDTVIGAEFEAQLFISENGDTLPYRILVPEKMKVGERLPMIIFLHGMGERGMDNKKQLIHGGEMFKQMQERYPAVVVFPQCPMDTYWSRLEFGGPGSTMKFPFYEEPSKGLAMVMELADHIVEAHQIDSKRQYLMGLSMGAFGTFEWLARQPEQFAAAVPICGGGNSLLAPLYAANTRVWIFHGDADSVVPVENSRKMAKALKEAGAEVKYTEYEGVDHNSWDNTLEEPNLLEWLFNDN